MKRTLETSDKLHQLIFDMVYKFSKSFNKIIDLSLDYNINIPDDKSKHVCDWIPNINLININTKKEMKGEGLFLGFLKNNEFIWCDLAQDFFKAIVDKSCEMIIPALLKKNFEKKSLDKTILLIKVFSMTNKAKFQEKYKEFIPILVSLFCTKGIIVRFKSDNQPSDDTDQYRMYYYIEGFDFKLPKEIINEQMEIGVMMIVDIYKMLAHKGGKDKKKDSHNISYKNIKNIL